MERRHPAGGFEVLLEGVHEIPDYRLRVIYPGGYAVEIDDPYRYGRIITDFDLYLFGEGKHTRIYDKLGAHLMRIGDVRRRALRRLGAQRRPRQRRRRLQRLGRPRAPDARRSVPSGVWEIFVPVGASRAALQVRAPRRATASCCSSPIRSASPSRCRRSPRRSSAQPRSRVAATPSGWPSRAAADAWLDRPMAVYEVHLGSWARVPEEQIAT